MLVLPLCGAIVCLICIPVGKFPGYLVLQTPLHKGGGQRGVQGSSLHSIPIIWLLANWFHFLFEHPQHKISVSLVTEGCATRRTCSSSNTLPSLSRGVRVVSILLLYFEESFLHVVKYGGSHCVVWSGVFIPRAAAFLFWTGKQLWHWGIDLAPAYQTTHAAEACTMSHMFTYVASQVCTAIARVALFWNQRWQLRTYKAKKPKLITVVQYDTQTIYYDDDCAR